MVGLEAHGASLLQDGLVGRVQPLAHHRDAIHVVVVVAWRLVVIVVVVCRLVALILFLVSQ